MKTATFLENGPLVSGNIIWNYISIGQILCYYVRPWMVVQLGAPQAGKISTEAIKDKQLSCLG